MTSETLDCQGMSCPMPIVEITKKVKSMESGQTLEVLATDLAFKLDVEAWSRRTGNELMSFDDGEIKKAIIQIT
ncbi:MAG: sulfurtransferase TusA family protein [Planctomycetales bacterium]|nr:sulfurtransferase TusA family protein [Planctomycetales bacterium]